MTTDPVVVQRALDRLMSVLEPLCESQITTVGSPQFLNSVCEYMTLSHPSPGRSWHAEYDPGGETLLLRLEAA